jgi:hypothetical protein
MKRPGSTRRGHYIAHVAIALRTILHLNFGRSRCCGCGCSGKGVQWAVLSQVRIAGFIDHGSNHNFLIVTIDNLYTARCTTGRKRWRWRWFHHDDFVIIVVVILVVFNCSVYSVGVGARLCDHVVVQSQINDGCWNTARLFGCSGGGDGGDGGDGHDLRTRHWFARGRCERIENAASSHAKKRSSRRTNRLNDEDDTVPINATHTGTMREDRGHNVQRSNELIFGVPLRRQIQIESCSLVTVCYPRHSATRLVKSPLGGDSYGTSLYRHVHTNVHTRDSNTRARIKVLSFPNEFTPLFSQRLELENMELECTRYPPCRLLRLWLCCVFTHDVTAVFVVQHSPAKSWVDVRQSRRCNGRKGYRDQRV